MKDKAELVRLIRRCEDMEYNSAKLAEALRLQALAEENGDPWCRIASCYFVAWSYLLTDDSAKALPVCAEFFQLNEQYPQNGLGAHCLLSLAAQSAAIALDMPQIPQEQCKALLDQLESLSKRHNMGRRLFLEASCRYHWEMGLLEEACRIFEHMRTIRPDATKDCLACNTAHEAWLLQCLGRWEEARRVAEPLLKGTLTCAHGLQPDSILITLLEDDLEHGDWDAAAVHAAHLSRVGFSGSADLSALGVFFCYQAATGQEGSLHLLEKGITWLIGLWDMSVQFDFYKGAWRICASLGKKYEKIDLRLSQKFPLYREDGQYLTQALADWFYKKAVEIGQKFDQRNGTNRYIKSLHIVEKGAHCNEQ